jgi:O-methyltransferase
MMGSRRFSVTDDFANDLAIVRQYTMLSRKRLYSLYECVLACEQHDIPGDYVECGVWKGGAVGLMALANLRYGKARRQLHLFDTFAGIPEPDGEVDGHRAVQEAGQYGVAALGRLTPNPQLYDNMGRGVGTVETNRELLEQIIGYDKAFIHYHQGLFQQTLPVVAPTIESVAILRLDGDWYASTKVCLHFLYDKVVRGGFVIIDDYGAYEGCKKAVDEFLAERNIKTRLKKVGSELIFFRKA